MADFTMWFSYSTTDTSISCSATTTSNPNTGSDIKDYAWSISGGGAPLSGFSAYWSGLTPSTTYQITVTGVCYDGTWGQGYVIVNTDPSPVVTPTFTCGSYQVNGYVITVPVSCTNPNGIATNARILYQSGSTWVNGDEHGQDSSTSWSDTLSITVSGPGTYTFAVRTWYSGQGPGSIVNQQTITITEPENNTWVYVNGWKRAQPWVYVNSSWHKATPYVYVNGSWHKV